jgi:hypothetical protein
MVSANTVAQKPAGSVNEVSQPAFDAAVVLVVDDSLPPVHAHTARIAAEDVKRHICRTSSARDRNIVCRLLLMVFADPDGLRAAESELRESRL